MKTQQKIDKTHFTGMHDQLLSLGKAKGVGRVLRDSPFGRIPSAAQFDVETNPYNMFLEKLGIRLRLPPTTNRKKTKFDYMNKYMRSQIKRIRKHVSKREYDKAGTIALGNISHSLSFRISAFNYIKSGWYYNMSLSEVERTLHRTNKLIRRFSHKLDYKRVYIEKANGKGRPLGVPKPEGRIMLHLLNGFFIEIMREQIPEAQHAYLPHKGVMSAGRSIFPKMKKYKGVYETDLKNFFPSVNVMMVIQIMRIRFKCPDKVTKGLEQLSRAIPKLPEEQKLDESKFGQVKVFKKYSELHSKERLEQILRYATLSKEPLLLNLRNLSIRPYRGEYPLSQEKLEHMERFYHATVLGGTILQKLNTAHQIPGGFPQGMPLSPFLSLFVVEDYINQGQGLTSKNKNPPKECVAYADDFVFFGDNKFEVVDIPHLGVNHAPEKCSGVKEDGKGTENGIKFLGFRLFENFDFQSETRSGTKGKLLHYFNKIYESDDTIKLISEMQDAERMEHVVRFVQTDFICSEKGIERPKAKDYYLKDDEAFMSKKDQSDLASAINKATPKSHRKLSSDELKLLKLQINALKDAYYLSNLALHRENLKEDLTSQREKVKEEMNLSEEQIQKLNQLTEKSEGELRKERAELKVKLDSLETKLLLNEESNFYKRYPGETSYEALMNIAKRNIFGFVMACMNLNDGENDHSYEDNLKAIRNMLGQLHPKSLLKRIPINTDSSGAIGYLAKFGSKSMRGRKKVLKYHEFIRTQYQTLVKQEGMDPRSLQRLRIRLAKREIRFRRLNRLKYNLEESLEE